MISITGNKSILHGHVSCITDIEIITGHTGVIRLMILTITNQKGGVSKTTTAHNLGMILFHKGFKVLFIDLDPQCNLTYLLSADKTKPTADQLLQNVTGLKESIQVTQSGIYFIAGSTGLTELTVSLPARKIKEILQPIKHNADFIIIDTPPALSAITISAITAADRILIPTTAGSMALSGILKLSATINEIRNRYNPAVKISGILLTRYSQRSVINRQLRSLLEDIALSCNTSIYKTTIRQSVTLDESQALQQDLQTYAPMAPITKDYIEFTEEFLKREGLINDKEII